MNKAAQELGRLAQKRIKERLGTKKYREQQRERSLKYWKSKKLSTDTAN